MPRRLLPALFLLLLALVVSPSLRAEPDPAVLWSLFDHEISGMESLIKERTAMIQTASAGGKDTKPDQEALEQFKVQTDLLREIRKVANVSIGRQYLIVFYVMSRANAQAALASNQLNETQKKQCQTDLRTYNAALTFLEYTPR